MKKTVKSEWLIFANHCTPPGASDDQVRDMNKIFYCGAAAVIEVLLEDKNSTAETMEKNFKAIFYEIDAFIKTTSRTDSNS